MNKNNSSKNKKILILHPYKFTEFKTYTYEIANLKKKYEVIIHDLSCVSSNKKYNEEWKTKKEKKSITFTSLYSWVREFNKIKKKENILVWDFLHYGSINFKVFIVQLILSFSRFPILKHGIVEVGCWTAEKNVKFFIEKILEHKLNFNIYLHQCREFFFTKLISFLKFKKIFLLINKNISNLENKKNLHFIKGHSFDYSNSLLEKNIKTKKIYIVYLDIGIPYFLGDAPSENRDIIKINNNSYYKDLNLCFDKLEKFFKAKVIVIPHSKYKMPKLKKGNLNPYYKKRINDNSYNAAAKLIPNCLFVISNGSTAISHAIIHYKPVVLFYTKKYKIYKWNQDKDIFFQANAINAKLLDFAFYTKEHLMKIPKVSKRKYDLYKYNYLTHKSNKAPKPIFKIIENIIEKQI